MEKCQIIHPFFWQINAKNLMPQAYYMLCRKFPDSYNKDSQAPYQLFRADQNCSFLQELWSRRSCGARPWEHRSHASLTRYVLVPETCPVSTVIRGGIVIQTRYPRQLQSAKKSDIHIYISQLSHTGRACTTRYWRTMAYFL